MKNFILLGDVSFLLLFEQRKSRLKAQQTDPCERERGGTKKREKSAKIDDSEQCAVINICIYKPDDGGCIQWWIAKKKTLTKRNSFKVKVNSIKPEWMRTTSKHKHWREAEVTNERKKKAPSRVQKMHPRHTDTRRRATFWVCVHMERQTRGREI